MLHNSPKLSKNQAIFHDFYTPTYIPRHFVYSALNIKITLALIPLFSSGYNLSLGKVCNSKIHFLLTLKKTILILKIVYSSQHNQSVYLIVI